MAEASPRTLTRNMVLSVMVVLTLINFINYIDRYLLSALLESIKTEFALTDGEAGRLFTLFMVVYMVVSPLTGWLGDRRTRKYLVAVGVGLWSLATIGSGYARDYTELSIMRALVGLGEAGYATVAPAMIADLYAPDRRGRMLAYFYLAIPVGSAIGFILGGQLAEHGAGMVGGPGLELLGLADAADPGWRLAFIIAGAPGLIMAIVAALIPEPVRGSSDVAKPADGEGGDAGEEKGPEHPVDILVRLLQSPTFRATTGGMTLMAFTIGGLAGWVPSFLQRAHGMSKADAGTIFGGITVVAGTLATLIGGRMGDRAFARRQGGYLSVSGWGLIAGAPIVVLLAILGAKTPVLIFIFFAEFVLFLNTGPLNAALVGCVPASLRASSVALNVLVIHGLGDAISPWLIGEVATAAGPALAGGILGATEGAAGLSFALLLTAIPVCLGGVWLVVGAKQVDAEPEGLIARQPEYGPSRMIARLFKRE